MSKPSRALGILSATLLCTTLAACGGDAEGEDGKTSLTFVGYGGDGQQAMIDNWQEPFTKEHPDITFVNTSPPDIAQVKAQVDSGAVQWDVVALAPAAAEQNCGTLFEPLTFDDLDTSELVDQAVGECYIGNFVLGTPFAYRTDAFPDPSTAPQTIEDFFDTEQFPGQRGVVANLQNGILEYPLLADGVAPDDLYPLDVDRALDKLDTIRSQTTFAPNVGALQEAIASEQVDLFWAPDSRLVPLMNDGVDITIVWDVTVVTHNGFGVPKGSDNLEEAEEFMAFVTGPEPSAGIAAALGVSPINLNAEPDLSDNGRKVQALDPEVNAGETVIQDIAWYGENYNQALEKLTKWLAG